MLLFENILLALTSLKANKTRSFLTMLGIIIGIASVITIMTIGESMSASVSDSMSSLGATNVTIQVSRKRSRTERSDSGFNFNRGPGRSAMTKDDYITLEMIQKFGEEFSGRIDGIILTESVGSGQIKHLNDYANVDITGYNSYGLEKQDRTMLSGRKFTDIDQNESRKVCVVSDYLVENMFGGDVDAALGEQITAVVSNKYYHYTIVGVYQVSDKEEYDKDENYDDSSTLYLPLETAVEQTHTQNRFSTVTAVGATDEDIDALMDDIKEFFNGRYYRNNENYEVSCTSLATLLDELTSMFSTISLAISLIAGISLLVGGIGVMNIMLVSVTERTKEIGTRKALGATNSSIRVQFIMESIMLCMVGGIIGIILGMIFGAVASTLMEFTAKPPVNGMIISVLFSMAIGIFFGYYPANKAAKMNPIDALRYE